MSKPTAQSAWISWQRLWAFVRPHGRTVALATLASIVAAAAAASWATLLGPLLESVLTGHALTVGGLTLAPGEATWKLPLAIIAVAIVKALASWLHSGLMTSVSQSVMATLRQRLYARVLTLPPAWLETRHSGTLLSTFTRDVAQVEFAVGQALSSWVKDVLQLIALLIVCGVIDMRLFLLVFIVLPAMIVPVSRFAKSARKAAGKSQTSVAALTQLASEQLSNLPVVQAYQLEGRALQALEAEQQQYLKVMKRSLFIRGAFTPTTEFLGIVGIALVLIFGSRAIAAEPSLAGHLLSFLAAALLMYQPTKALSGTYSQVIQGLSAADRLFDILDAPQTPGGALPATALSKDLDFNGVTVAYPDGRLGLSNFSARFEHHKLTALVGTSGSGKSTLINVLLRFVETQSGSAQWNGGELTSYLTDSLRDQMAWVPQEAVLFSGTVRDNVLLGKPGASDAEVWAALEQAHLGSLIRSWANGLDEEVGERGNRLSGGQRQRLALARAFLKQPSVLLLDEPTSALDSESEAAVQQGLRELMTGRTSIVIAHRLSTVEHADCIHVLAAGRVVESGTHAELLARRGAYAHLVAAARGDSL